MVPLNLIRAALGLLTVFFAYFLGRCLVHWAARRATGGRTTAWLLRFALALGAILWSGGLDATAIVTIAGAGAAGVYGAWLEHHPREPEDLSKQIVPRDFDHDSGSGQA